MFDLSLLHNLTPFQIIVISTFLIYLACVWFFSDGLSNIYNAVAFTITFIGLCAITIFGYQLLTQTLTEIPSRDATIQQN